MSIPKRILKAITPAFIRRYLRRLHRDYIFSRAMRRFISDPQGAITTQEPIISDLIYGWGNEDWSALNEYLSGCLNQAFLCKGAVLECGSGLTTLLLGALGQRTGNRVWSLEHDPRWGSRVDNYLKKFQIDSVNLLLTPLQDYGEFSWYTPTLDSMPEKFDMVVCDGPPGDTPGGRYGLLPIMGTKLQSGSVILLDDAARTQEAAIAARWAAELGTDYEVLGIQKPYIRITLK
ncbi:MAG: hypothetical protein WCA35_28950 [Kovacikia sp.]